MYAIRSYYAIASSRLICSFNLISVGRGILSQGQTFAPLFSLANPAATGGLSHHKSFTQAYVITSYSIHYTKLYDIANVYSLRRGAAEAIEAIAHGDENTSKVVGRTVGELKLPPGTTIGAVVRGDEVIIAHDSTVIQQDDHVVMFLRNNFV